MRSATPAVMAGNGTIALEILEELPDVDAVITPYGGGGLTCGVAAALRHFKPDTRVYAAEVESAAPLAASLEAGEPVEVDVCAELRGRHRRAVCVRGDVGVRAHAGGRVDRCRRWRRRRAAIRLLAQRNRVVAEGAGAAPVAAALSGEAGSGKVVCVVSGGNIDADKLAKILAGQMPLIALAERGCSWESDIKGTSVRISVAAQCRARTFAQPVSNQHGTICSGGSAAECLLQACARQRLSGS